MNLERKFIDVLGPDLSGEEMAERVGQLIERSF
jgi:hypothetical protein